jgi:hypothetical protein
MALVARQRDVSIAKEQLMFKVHGTAATQDFATDGAQIRTDEKA